MIISKLVLNNFRNYVLSVIELDAGVNYIYGPNATGKTSLMEAIYLLSTGESFRSGKIDEMIRFNQEVARVSSLISEQNESEINNSGDDEKLEIMLNRGLVQGRRTQKRLYTVNDIKKRKKDFVGKFFVVAFRPEDMRLVEGSKGRRRKFMDEALSTLDWQYARSLKMYDEALVKKNKLLWQIKEGLAPKTSLHYWSLTVLKHGQYLQAQRQKLLESFSQVTFPLSFTVSYLPSLINEVRQAEYESREIASGHSLIGPHKDDFSVFLTPSAGESFDAAIYGSRGQQRMAVLWLKVCQLVYLEQVSNQKALLLLDDILSELDEVMKEKVFSLLGDRQSIITSADESSLSEVVAHFKKAHLINLSEHIKNGTKF